MKLLIRKINGIDRVVLSMDSTDFERAMFVHCSNGADVPAADAEAFYLLLDAHGVEFERPTYMSEVEAQSRVLSLVEDRTLLNELDRKAVEKLLEKWDE